MSADAYEMVVGLEVHVQLKTRTKVFCGCSTDFGAPPNSNTCPVCLALPGCAAGAQRARGRARDARRARAWLQGATRRPSSPARTTSIRTCPRATRSRSSTGRWRPAGALARTTGDGEDKSIGITRVHMEEDAGKSIHDRFPGITAIDLNRAGVPLIEIVSEPDIRSAPRPALICERSSQILEYVDVSDVNMEEGSLRVDANVSARRRGETKLGTKTEVKNMNSFSGVERALTSSSRGNARCSTAESGSAADNALGRWERRGAISRSKEESHDYRYFPEPDLPPLILDREWIASITASMPELPPARKKRIAADFSLATDDIEVLTPIRGCRYFETVARATATEKRPRTG